MMELPAEILHIILGYLTLKELMKLKLVNKFFCEFIKKNKWNTELVITNKNMNEVEKFMENHRFSIYTINNNSDITQLSKYMVGCLKFNLISGNYNPDIKCFTNCRSFSSLMFIDIDKSLTQLLSCNTLCLKQSIYCNTITKEQIKIINSLNIKSLSLIDLSFPIADLSLSGLKYLDLSGSIFNTNISLLYFDNIEYLLLNHCKLDDSCIMILCAKNLENLKFLSLEKNNITEKSIKYLSKLNLEYLNVNLCYIDNNIRNLLKIKTIVLDRYYT